MYESATSVQLYFSGNGPQAPVLDDDDDGDEGALAPVDENSADQANSKINATNGATCQEPMALRSIASRTAIN